MPLTFEALKGQRYRWCFGGIQILRMHWRSLLPGRNNPENRLTTAQRWSYLSGAVQWYGDLLGLLFLTFLLAGAANLATGGGELFRKLSAFLVATVPVLVALGLVRAVALLRRGTGASWRDALGAFFIWQSTSLVVARASVLGLFAREAAFLRTPKTSERAHWWESLRANWAETSLALLGALGIAAALTRATQLSGPLLAALLLFPTLGMAAAPFNSWAAQRAALPPELRQRRRTENARDRRALKAGVATGGVVAVLGVIVAAVALWLTPSPRTVQPPQLVGPAQSGQSPTAKPTPSRSSTSPSPSSSPSSTSPTTTPAPTGSATATATPTPTASPTTGSPTPSAELVAIRHASAQLSPVTLIPTPTLPRGAPPAPSRGCSRLSGVLPPECPVSRGALSLVTLTRVPGDPRPGDSHDHGYLLAPGPHQRPMIMENTARELAMRAASGRRRASRGCRAPRRSRRRPGRGAWLRRPSCSGG